MGQGCGNGKRKWWKRLNFCGSGSRITLKKKLEAKANSEVITLYEAGCGSKNILLLPHPCWQQIGLFNSLVNYFYTQVLACSPSYTVDSETVCLWLVNHSFDRVIKTLF